MTVPDSNVRAGEEKADINKWLWNEVRVLKTEDKRFENEQCRLPFSRNPRNRTYSELTTLQLNEFSRFSPNLVQNKTEVVLIVNSALHAAHVKVDFSEWRNHFPLVQHVENKHWLPRFFVLAGRKTKAWIVKSTGNEAGNHTSAIIYSLLTLDFKLNNQYVCNIWMRVIPVAWKLSQWRTRDEGAQERFIRWSSTARSPTLAYPFMWHFWQKRYLFRITSIDKWFSFHIPTV